MNITHMKTDNKSILTDKIEIIFTGKEFVNWTISVKIS